MGKCLLTHDADTADTVDTVDTNQPNKKHQPTTDDSYGGDPKRIFLSGHSAGGNIAALLAMADGWLHESILVSSILILYSFRGKEVTY